MKNKKKYAEQILDIACQGGALAIDKNGELVNCNYISCSECEFNGIDCGENTKKWCESEYIEKPKISESDRRFLDYLPDEYKYMARDENGELYAFSKIPKKDVGHIWVVDSKGFNAMALSIFNIDFPMVKWEDSEPWLIEDLKKLEVER